MPDSGKRVNNIEVLADHRPMGLQESASSWTPREMLQSLINQIDRGEIAPKAIVICISDNTISADAVNTLYRCSSPDLYISLGLMEHAKAHMLRGDD